MYFTCLATVFFLPSLLVAVPCREHTFSKVRQGRVQHNLSMSMCDRSLAIMPNSPIPLPSPSEGLMMQHVAVGRGTQNYTCQTGVDTDAPEAAGAVATLFNATCKAATYSEFVSSVPRIALEYDVPTSGNDLSAVTSLLSGYHYFLDSTTPFFDFHVTGSHDYGSVALSKLKAEDAPEPNVLGQGNTGFGSVAWLKLGLKNGTESMYREVYRVDTAGGNPPETCEGMPEAFEVEYSAVYWFYGFDY